MAKDEVEAVKWYRKAAEQNYAEAQYNLGCCYANGQGVAKDEVEAVKWFRKAAEGGEVKTLSMLWLGFWPRARTRQFAMDPTRWSLRRKRWLRRTARPQQI